MDANLWAIGCSCLKGSHAKIASAAVWPTLATFAKTRSLRCCNLRIRNRESCTIVWRTCLSHTLPMVLGFEKPDIHWEGPCGRFVIVSDCQPLVRMVIGEWPPSLLITCHSYTASRTILSSYWLTTFCQTAHTLTQ